jgi:hypothetical protein
MNYWRAFMLQVVIACCLVLPIRVLLYAAPVAVGALLASLSITRELESAGRGRFSQALWTLSVAILAAFPFRVLLHISKWFWLLWPIALLLFFVETSRRRAAMRNGSGKANHNDDKNQTTQD